MFAVANVRCPIGVGEDGGGRCHRGGEVICSQRERDMFTAWRDMSLKRRDMLPKGA